MNVALWLEWGILLVLTSSFWIFSFLPSGILEVVQALVQVEDMSLENVVGVPFKLTQVKGLFKAWSALLFSKMTNLSKEVVDEKLHIPKRKIPTAMVYLPKRDLFKYIVINCTWLPLLDSRSIFLFHKVHPLAKRSS